MKIANLSGRLVIVEGQTAYDVAKASDGRFGPEPQSAYADWAAFASWAAGADLGEGQPFAAEDLGAPVPEPGQIFAIGLNYRDHAAEAGLAVPDGVPPTFTKFKNCLSGPVSTVTLPAGGQVDWEVELVVVIGKAARNVAAADAWEHVAGLTAGQDLSERVTQSAGPAPQFSLGKSFEGFGPTGPYVVTPDELADRDAIALSCAIDGETMQDGNTSNLVFSVPVLIEKLSAVLPLDAGDIIFTGTPAGVGLGRTPKRFLADGEVLTSKIDGIGELRQTFVAQK
ncbi:fumarylacetoacetate hydrolase family protein [Cumulibacter manganitolerans]|uniref:fumarylacetoacetate hydrolase family protein n=1 Tax=Cumulibacter manganitolerans TaxID=1884992 RepID=UPI0012963335|nr:fumarylacetoacetate hydrolase family protein [Cumulibacter manganitolerans]